MGAFGQRLLEAAAGDHAGHMRRVVQHIGADLVGDLAHLAQRVGKQAEAAGDGDQLRPQALRLAPQPVQVDGHARAVIGHGMGLDAVEPGGAGLMVSHMAAHLAAEGHDAVARLGGRHEAVEIAERAGGHAQFGKGRAEQLLHQVFGDDLDLLGIFHAHLVLVAGIAEAGPVAEGARQQRRRPGVHHVGAGIEAEGLPVHMALVIVDQRHQPRLDRIEVVRDQQLLDVGDAADAFRRQPGFLGDGNRLRHGALFKPPAPQDKSRSVTDYCAGFAAAVVTAPGHPPPARRVRHTGLARSPFPWASRRTVQG